MLSSLLSLLLGLAGLYFGAEWLVRGASRLALALRVRPLFIGLTIVAFGTSMPEMVVCVVAAAQGKTDVALGNVLGSNVANVGLILALSAVLSPVHVASRLAQRELPFMLGVTLAFYALAWRMSFGRLEGLLLLATLVVFTRLSLHWALGEPPPVAAQFESSPQQRLHPRFRYVRELTLVTIGLAVLVGGGHLLVRAAADLARYAGISELVIAATLVAVGSSLPELATSIVAALRHEAGLLVGNLVGSNLFNILGALGVSALIRPVKVDASLLSFEFVALLFFSAAMALFLRSGHRMSRSEGAVLLVLYVGFVLKLFLL
ncbi:MAG: calcium/sodium antiporter [Terriglobia bacterium]